MSQPQIRRAGQRLVRFADDMRPFVRRLLDCDEAKVAWRISEIAEELRKIGDDLHARHGQPRDVWRNKARART